MAEMVSDNFADILDPRFERIFDDKYKELPDMVPSLYNTVPTNSRDTMRWSDVGAVEDFVEFSGTVNYSSRNQGYDTVATPVEFARGIQIERKLFDDDQFNIMDRRPAGLARAAFRTRQQHAADVFINATSVVTTFYNNSEAVALGSNSHTTTSGASTANGFDNLTTAALTATAVQAARIQMRGFRGDQAERISVMPDTILVPPDLEEAAYEITASSGKVDTADNNRNIHEGRYKVIDWEYLSDTNDWFLIDSSLKEEMLFWTDRIPLEFAMVEDFDTFVAKWRGYMRYAMAHTDWRWICVASVT